MKSISFDRAADTYDETRGFPPGIADQVADSVMQVLPPGAGVLEVGVGTGRIAKPLLARGLVVTGVDLSPKMMRRLLDTLPPGVSAPSLVQADAAQLPFAVQTFEAVLSVHVFHLIAQWQEALAEVRRVLKPEGAFLAGYEQRPPDSPGTQLLNKWREIVQARGITPHAGPGARDFDDVKAALFQMGAVMDEWSVGEWTTARTIARQIETIEHRTWSSTWAVPDDFFPQSLAELREWALREYGSLEREFVVPHKFIWQRFRWL
jgi:ubiquinone/menaquinone biosynthesis C-methylase UbiE